MSNKSIVSILFAVLLLFIIYLAVYFVPTIRVEYDLTDCITYFDDRGQYQLLRAGEYFFYDAETKKSISSIVIYYTVDNDCFYAVCAKSMGYNGEYRRENVIYKQCFFVFNMSTKEKIIAADINELDSNSRRIFTDSNMVDLSKKRNSFAVWFSKFIPYNMRKW
ncbi:MAG: hypothetical protein J6N52_02795 [Clostridia bacterium]|nr:hypothetical protein [Clostridia bacterium]